MLLFSGRRSSGCLRLCRAHPPAFPYPFPRGRKYAGKCSLRVLSADDQTPRMQRPRSNRTLAAHCRDMSRARYDEGSILCFIARNNCSNVCLFFNPPSASAILSLLHFLLGSLPRTKITLIIGGPTSDPSLFILLTQLEASKNALNNIPFSLALKTI